jgi:hypothetical protein
MRRKKLSEKAKTQIFLFIFLHIKFLGGKRPHAPSIVVMASPIDELVISCHLGFYGQKIVFLLHYNISLCEKPNNQHSYNFLGINAKLVIVVGLTYKSHHVV